VQCDEVHAITFDYGQRHKRELDNAKQVARHYGVNHKIVSVNFLSEIGGSALTDKNIEVRENELSDDIPDTYVPGRNMLFIALTTSYAEVIGAEVIYTGVNAVDYSGYPDCRPEFIKAMQDTINLATKVGVTDHKISISTPLINMSKEDIIKLGTYLGVPYELTTSCYNGGEKACGKCDSCLLRLKGFEDAGIEDPIDYEIN
jgi:7-cyano-7-deazaguanine synthase